MMETHKVSVESTGSGLQVKAGTRGFTLTFDEPEASGGTNAGMNPVEGLLCALGACESIATMIFAHMQGVPLEGVRVEAEGDIDTDGFMGINPDVPCGLSAARISFNYKCADEKAARELEKLVEKRCPVGDTIRRAVPVTCTGVNVEA